ncbi:methionine ABC transporter ATP-binding protein [Thermaerobacillus caldiproteolyticus]|uniref:D-methionine transport system ATP-binding protein n=1 Tax=Thermaerobacillus caldiproteolyticus TaxID=247480 RepID=A0A7W0C0D0_9BACL|nr:methionine ABC transporter ATP-binding protein [Anoxybacillus caldiproteolyticus]MBA2875139.1 D-methionine transport system ATP-binding protein [Anoxybacillus caldiproteolyticus]QPA32902.1 methionine ABC transporter ATP-binding protein [Anoxybacillus caldiproteolyticus]
MIEFRNASKIFKSEDRTIEALKNINLTIEKGDIFGVIGFSGAGKSTLIRMVNLLEKPTSGQVLVDGQDLSKLSEKELRQAKKNIGMIFQHFNLLRSKTVFDNVAMPLKLSKTPKSVIEERVHELLHFVGLSDKANSYPDQLSGGQKQRVGIARALATNPSILLCDEPTSALDPQTTTSILQLLKRVNQEYNVTILMITHEMEVIKQICNRVAVMQNGEIIEEGTILDIFSKPKTETARNFVRSVLRDEIPQSIFHILQANDKFSKIYNIEFIGESSGKPILSQVAKSFAVDVNILFGSINELQGVPFGNLIVELQGEEAEIARAYDFIVQQNVLVNEVIRNGG